MENPNNKIRDAFSRIKEDIEFLNDEIRFLRKELAQTREQFIKACDIMINFDKKMAEPQELQKTQEKSIPTHQHIIQTVPTHNPTHNLPFNALKDQNKAFSIGNQGVPTDRQTDRQTDRTRKKAQFFIKKTPQNSFENNKKYQNFAKFSEKIEKNEVFSEISTNSIDNAAKILDSLDSIKKEIRLKFKQLTNQEMIVFSILYQLEEDTGNADYKTLAKSLSLTESSVRDYIGRLIKKGIPIEKKRINNKTVLLSISANLKKITSLPTIMQLRDL